MTQTAPFTLIGTDEPATIESAARKLGLLDSGEQVLGVERAGEGNMNLVLRIETDRRRFILKQSRPWVEKYPQIAAPADRLLAEVDFYERVEPYDELAASMPKLLRSEGSQRLMALEDLGEASDYADLYETRDLDAFPLQEATAWLAKLHAVVLEPPTDEIGNYELRKLNHAHIFEIPFQTPSAIPLDSVCEGLESVAAEFRQHPLLQTDAEALGKKYLGRGPTLLHGDFYPGSWLRTEAGLRIIDPEFCFAGPREFDLGVLAAHRILVGGNEDSLELVRRTYETSGGTTVEMDLLKQFAGIELIRRLIGVAQLPLNAPLNERTRMLEMGGTLLGRTD
ncbi:MAG: phosphotransferase [Planctomycetota bacterium]